MITPSRLTGGCRLFFLALLLIFAQSTQAQNTTPSVESFDASQILSILHRIDVRLDAIRFYMGKPENEISGLEISGAAPHEVYFQAVNLYQKADRLALEITRTTQPIKSNGPASPITDTDVYHVASYALDRINFVASNLGITITDNLDFLPLNGATSSDAYEIILDTNQKINHLLEEKYSPGDVFQQVTSALHLTFTLFERFPEERRIIKEPELIPGKQPGDVYQLLLRCFSVVREIAQLSSLELLELSSTPKVMPYIPSEVHDVATLLTSELRFIHDSAPGLSEPALSHFPGRKYPFHVYQRGQVLYQTLLRLRDLIAANPDWRA
jgi:hypothetical protein